MKKKIIAVLCAAAMTPVLCVKAEYNQNDLKDAAENAIDWKEDNDSPFYGIGTNNSNLYIIALRRLGMDYDYASYLAGLDGIAAGYGAEHNASDMQRTVLAAIASNGDPGNIGGRDLIAESTYYRDAAAPLDKEGADGYSWALIALDSKGYETPDWALKNRNQIIAGLLSHQNTDGSFDGSVSETAAAVAALAPYYETSGAYTITQNQTGWTFDLSPRSAVDSAINYLSDEQSRDGDWGDLESTAMTIIALDAMGIDADDDYRFKAKKGTALDGLMMYQEKDGGFSSDLNDSDGEATSFALCALTSHLRYMQDKSTIFNFKINDYVELEAPSTATAEPSESSPSSGSGSSSATARPSATAKTSSSSATKATAKPSSSSASKATAKPSSSNASKATAKPSNTLRPARTTAPYSSGAPSASSKPEETPKATKRPALVGPVEMPGPMPSSEPSQQPLNGANEKKETSNGSAAAVVVGIIALIAIAGVFAIWYLRGKGLLPKSIENAVDNIVNVFTGKKEKKTDKSYKAKNHRRTEQHRKYENREKYRNRRKFDKRRNIK